MANTISLSNQSMLNLYKIGNVGKYASNAVKNSLTKDGSLKTDSTSSSGFWSGLLGTAQGTTNNTLFKTMSFARENTSNLSLLKTSASSLSSAAKSMGASTLVSSDSSVVTAKASLYSKSSMSLNIGVSNLATSQQSSSAQLSSSENSSFGVGQNSFVLETENGSHTIDFTVDAGDTNEDTLKAIAGKINESKAGVSAEVVSEDGKSSLKLTSKETGDLAYFQVSGTPGGNNAAQTLDLQTTQEAKDANYTINGQSFSSATNTVSIPDGRGAKMTLTGEGSASLTKATDASAVVDAAKTFASAYNQAVSHLMSGSADGAGVTRALGLVANNGMTAMSIASYGGHAASRLSSMGISIDDEGMMQVDSKKLTAAVQESPASVREALAGYGGVASTAANNADQAMRIPAATYTNFSNMQVQSSLLDALMPSTGFLFDIAL
ncbi:flagellar filament capping protein FliD [Christensenellaceae bacterium OttesenSCG-928-K19]|nr:flagellar filament capping protein FliD [Christensenellaceae bacterium OttesenSCG-928-K19]